MEDYVNKKIIIERSIPKGATHYYESDGVFVYYKIVIARDAKYCYFYRPPSRYTKNNQTVTRWQEMNHFPINIRKIIYVKDNSNAS